jgi:hypothetical protein
MTALLLRKAIEKALSLLRNQVHHMGGTVQASIFEDWPGTETRLQVTLRWPEAKP